ncbi:MAG TPA: hypothetical protein VNY05_20910 [Candidatus Acidoferrales bacterium]|jgi:hypothetical protein|nr:hypothetical protein [Candidatus Acidoferrales bacterium]
MWKVHAALDTLIATACGAVAIVVFLPVLLLTTGVKALLTARETPPLRAATGGEGETS